MENTSFLGRPALGLWISHSKKVSIEITDDACDYGMKLFQRKRMQKDTLALIIYS